MLPILMSGCAAGPATVMIDTSCDWVRPVLISKHDVLTDGTKRQILAHNEGWAAICPEASASPR